MEGEGAETMALIRTCRVDLSWPASYPSTGHAAIMLGSMDTEIHLTLHLHVRVFPTFTLPVCKVDSYVS